MNFYIFTSTPDANRMARYERDELDEVFGPDNARKLAAGVAIFTNGGIHVNAEHAALERAEEILFQGDA